MSDTDDLAAIVRDGLGNDNYGNALNNATDALDALVRRLHTLEAEADHARELLGSQICQDDALGTVTPSDVVTAYFVLRDVLVARAALRPGKETPQ